MWRIILHPSMFFHKILAHPGKAKYFCKLSCNALKQSTYNDLCLHSKFLSNCCFYSIKAKREESKDKVKKIPDEEPVTIIEKCVDCFPTRVQPYLKLMRIHKPAGGFLLLWPCYWSIALAANPGSLPDFYLITLFSVGTVLMRGAGCTINDMWDRDIDIKVHRTRNRPLARGDISTLDAVMFLGGQLALSLLILLQLNWYSIIVGASSLFVVCIYPAVKRVSYWPQFILGFAFNWGALLGWAAVQGNCQWSVVLPLYAAGIAWTLVYDTVYAHQDKADDIKVKVKSTALLFQENTKYYLSGFSAIMMMLLTLTGYNCSQTWPYYSSIGIIGTILASQIATLNIDSPDSCWRAFKVHKIIGLVLFCGIMGGNLLRQDNNIQKLNKSGEKFKSEYSPSTK